MEAAVRITQPACFPNASSWSPAADKLFFYLLRNSDSGFGATCVCYFCKMTWPFTHMAFLLFVTCKNHARPLAVTKTRELWGETRLVWANRTESCSQSWNVNVTLRRFRVTAAFQVNLNPRVDSCKLPQTLCDTTLPTSYIMNQIRWKIIISDNENCARRITVIFIISGSGCWLD